jgi:hypothetical protein
MLENYALPQLSGDDDDDDDDGNNNNNINKNNNLTLKLDDAPLHVAHIAHDCFHMNFLGR